MVDNKQIRQEILDKIHEFVPNIGTCISYQSDALVAEAVKDLAIAYKYLEDKNGEESDCHKRSADRRDVESVYEDDCK